MTPIQLTQLTERVTREVVGILKRDGLIQEPPDDGNPPEPAPQELETK